MGCWKSRSRLGQIDTPHQLESVCIFDASPSIHYTLSRLVPFLCLLATEAASD